VAGVFLIDVRLEIAAWLAAAAHEVPQELGDFGVLIRGGWTEGTALLLDPCSGLTFLVGGLVACAASARIDAEFLVPSAAGNFIYIGASDLVPEVNKHRDLSADISHVVAFVAGIAPLRSIRLALQPWGRRFLRETPAAFRPSLASRGSAPSIGVGSTPS